VEPALTQRISGRGSPARQGSRARALGMIGVGLASLLLLIPGCALVPNSRQEVGSATAGDFPYHNPVSGLPTLAPLMRRVTPAVVDVAVKSQLPVEDNPFLSDPDFRRFLERFGLPLPDEEEEDREPRQSIGSGIIVDAARGYVLTNDHLLQNAIEIRVRLQDGRGFRAQRLGADPTSDVAILKIPPVAIRPLALGDSDRLEVGDFVIAIGNPFGLGQTVTSGIVSAVGRKGVGGNRLGEMIQTDASINPGNSGGPLINLAGEVVGISTALIGLGGGNVGIGFAIPSNRARVALERVVGR
jgi:S1-C subfamily serine protease